MKEISREHQTSKETECEKTAREKCEKLMSRAADTGKQ